MRVAVGIGELTANGPGGADAPGTVMDRPSAMKAVLKGVDEQISYR
jgi:hypothetical protein